MDQVVKPWRRFALIFPGQGSHHVGMGQRLAEVSCAARNVFRRADEVLDAGLSKLCFEGPPEELEQTVNQQPAMFVTSIAWLEALRERWSNADERLAPHIVAGHSLGEFSAAVAAGSLGFEDALLLVQQRGLLMEDAGRENPGGMASILGLSEAQVRQICQEAAVDGPVTLATSNCEGQNVISGALKPLQRAMELADRAGARRVIKLPITIASHSPLMARASEGMSKLLARIPMRDPDRPIVGNIEARILETKPEVHDELRDQLTAAVRWQASVEEMRAQGIDLFLEVGPGNVLTRVVRRIDYGVNSFSLSDDYEGLLSENFKQLEAARQ
jgi:[acyl-carrier-protein] S-malonyltransferase